MTNTNRTRNKFLAVSAVLLATTVTMMLTTNGMLGQGPGGDGPGAAMRGPRQGPGGMGHGMEHHDGGPEARLLPPGMWWRDTGTVSAIGLSSDQQKHIDQIFLDSRVQLIHMHASLEEEQLRLDEALRTTPFDQAKAMASIDKTADTRAMLEKTDAKMLLTIRDVLTADQWTKLQAMHARGPRPEGRQEMGGDHRRGPSSHGGRGPQGGPPPPPAGRDQATPPPTAE
jgi:Spy/CpxP family protein refolding chaperone